ncbi:hypothetical protein [Enterococcus gilvus]|uniref:Uncharacterized protein n=1 Tax=Enterococcus gilvus ATCC BAA-350 TaxID=1158614 RepID=R2VLU7_9ENTE|nr:hypothetical protein [Enterococcus gilvus]EOI58845.1 hypothetical protein UKC_00030 [Enterococcus gilvus ATCC BAA-350]EOW79278.1 hypothetical protein I592_03417 [Enterococcus gilvus ATCC BAA-350]OJG40522.1 hypothetical protein RV02_GL002023 [Enterococcus gilvus]
MNRYKVKKMFRDARTNEIYSAGVLITITKDRAEEIIEKLGSDFIELVPETPGQIDDFVQEAIDKETAPLIEEINQLRMELSMAQTKLAAKEIPPAVEQAPDSSTIEEFPKMISRGHYELSNGESFDGNKAAAEEAEKALVK